MGESIRSCIFIAHQSGPCPTSRTTEDPLVQDSLNCRLRKIAICRVSNRYWNYNKYQVFSIFDKLVAVLTSMPRWKLLKNQFLYTDEYYDAIQYERLVFAATIRGIVFAWNPYGFGMFVFHRIIVSSTCMRVS